MLFLVGLVASAFLRLSVGLNTAVINAPAVAPSDTSQAVKHDFGSISIAIHWWHDYAGNATTGPNEFSRVLLEVLGNKTATLPQIRIGGTSADRTTYIVEQSQDIILTNGPNGIPTNVTIGPSFFSTYDNFPEFQFVVDLPLSRNDSGAEANAIAEGRAVYGALGSRLFAYELGNEPDFYPSYTFNRPVGYTLEDWVSEWRVRARAVFSRVLEGNKLGMSAKLFQTGTFTYPASEDFDAIRALQAGIADDDQVKSMSIHLYPIMSIDSGNLRHVLMNHTAIVSSLAQSEADVKYIRQHYPGMSYVLGETNSDPFNLDQDQISGVFGSALWTIGYMLQAASIGVDRVNLHQGTTFGYSAWRPVPVHGRGGPIVRPPYYGLVFFADFIGTYPDVRIGRLEINDVDNANIASYAAYHSDQLKKIAVINYNYWDVDSTYARESQTFTAYVPQGYHQAKVEFLRGNGAIADTDITWAGQSWNYSSGGYAYDVEHSTVYLDIALDRSIDFDVQATEAAIVTFV